MALEDTLEDIIQHFITKMAELHGKDTLGQVKAEEVRRDLYTLFQSAVEEVGKGTCLSMRWYSCMGRKKS